MSNKKSPQIYGSAIEIYIDKFNLYGEEYKYIGKDKDGLYLYDYIPKYNEVRNVFNILNEKYTSYIYDSEYNTNIEKNILGLFKDGEIILIEKGIKRIKGLINEETLVDKLFKLLSEVQGVEIKPYDKFDIKYNNETTLIDGPYYFDKEFRRYDKDNDIVYNEKILRDMLTGKAKVLKIKKSVILEEDDIICLRYYLKNGYRYITNNRYIDFIETRELRGFKNNPQKNNYLDNRWSFVRYDEEIKHYEEHLNIKDKLSFIHYEYPEIWDIEELLEQERVSND